MILYLIIINTIWIGVLVVLHFYPIDIGSKNYRKWVMEMETIKETLVLVEKEQGDILIELKSLTENLKLINVEKFQDLITLNEEVEGFMNKQIEISIQGKEEAKELLSNINKSIELIDVNKLDTLTTLMGEEFNQYLNELMKENERNRKGERINFNKITRHIEKIEGWMEEFMRIQKKMSYFDLIDINKEDGEE